MSKKVWKKDLQRKRPYRVESIRQGRAASVVKLQKEREKRQEEERKEEGEKKEKEEKKLSPPQLELPVGVE